LELGNEEGIKTMEYEIISQDLGVIRIKETTGLLSEDLVVRAGVTAKKMIILHLGSMKHLLLYLNGQPL